MRVKEIAPAQTRRGCSHLLGFLRDSRNDCVPSVSLRKVKTGKNSSSCLRLGDGRLLADVTGPLWRHDSTGVDALQGFLIRPRQPMLRALLHPPAVTLKAGEIVEGSDSVKPAGVDQTHEQVADLGSVLGL